MRKQSLIVIALFLLALPLISAQTQAPAVNFDGSTYTQRGAALTGGADAQTGTICMWVKQAGADGATQAYFGTLSGDTQLTRSTGNAYEGYQALLLSGYDQTRSSNTTIVSGSGWHQVCYARSGTTGIMVVDGIVVTSSVHTGTSSANWGTGTNAALGAYVGGSSKFTGCLAEVWIDDGYIDFSQQANRDKFYANGTAPDLGPTGNNPTGAAPLIFFSNDSTNWNTNKGTAGNFATTAGTLTNCADGPPRPAGPVITTPINLTATATDIYDGSTISNFSLSIKRGNSVIYNSTTLNGTIYISNITNGFGNITFQSNQSPTGFLEVTYLDVNIAGQNFRANMTPIAPLGPNATLGGNNFFNSQNSTIISLGRASAARLNFSFADDIRLYGFEFNITMSNGSVLINFTNVSLSGTLDNFTRLVNVRGPQGYYTAGLTVWDSHTKEAIPDYKVESFVNTIKFNDKITITSPYAISTSAKKIMDSYNFEFGYVPFFAPEDKIFYIESEDGLDYIEDSAYRGHLVDWKNKNWIDFEGEGEISEVIRISDKKYEIRINQKGHKIKLKSIGGLNSRTYTYQYYLSNETLLWTNPTNGIYDSFLNSSYTALLSVTGDGKNRTQFYLSNSSYGVVQSQNITQTSNGTYVYSVSFNSLTDHTYYINASNYDVDVGIFNVSPSATLYNIQLNNCAPVGTPSVNFTILDENNGSRINSGSFDLESDYYHSTKTGTKAFDVTSSPTNNYTVCIWPYYESVLVDYTILYSGTGYPQRRYSDNGAIFDNQTQTINLYLLSENDGIYGRFRIVDQFGNSLTGAIGQMALTGTSTIVEQEESDGSGLMTFFLDPNQDYDFTFSLSGYQTVDTTLRVTTTEIYTITLSSAAAAQDQPLASGIVYSFLPSATLLQNSTNYIFSFNLSSSYWNISSCNFTLSNQSTNLNTSAIISSNSSNCIGVLQFFTGNQTSLIARGIIDINGTTITYTKAYSIRYSFQGHGSFKYFIDDINSFADSTLGNTGKFFIAILFIMLATGALYYQTDYLRDVEDAIITFIILTWAFSYIGWVYIDYPLFPSAFAETLKQYLTAILVSMTGTAFILNKNR